MSRIASRDPAAPRLTGRLSRTDLLWVANTAHGPAGHWHARVRSPEPDHDHLATPEAALRYLVDHRVPTPAEPPDAAALGELALIRSAVGGLLEREADPWTPGVREFLAGATFALGRDGGIASTEGGWRGFCRDLLLPLVALVADGAPLRRCANPGCRLLFEDSSRSHTRRWCDAAACGNRDRVGRARRRPARRPATAGAASR